MLFIRYLFRLSTWRHVLDNLTQKHAFSRVRVGARGPQVRRSRHPTAYTVHHICNKAACKEAKGGSNTLIVRVSTSHSRSPRRSAAAVDACHSTIKENVYNVPRECMKQAGFEGSTEASSSPVATLPTTGK